ncbi:hypothetical protein CEXT_213371 [Caerostris extrusa]|uniref:Uncharacterized protein n=1 Tax=Caerostris extrusa TaxID=172846 RepID=A0AAV4NCL3_CAEEX|nr:hypothetical protein CEXT_213371 [Caerostris extrusa]
MQIGVKSTCPRRTFEPALNPDGDMDLHWWDDAEAKTAFNIKFVLKGGANSQKMKRIRMMNSRHDSLHATHINEHDKVEQNTIQKLPQKPAVFLRFLGTPASHTQRNTFYLLPPFDNLILSTSSCSTVSWQNLSDNASKFISENPIYRHYLAKCFNSYSFRDIESSGEEGWKNATVLFFMSLPLSPSVFSARYGTKRNKLSRVLSFFSVFTRENNRS